MRQDDIRRQISGRAIPLPGNDIDTDRIIPARFLKCITFEGLEAHVFEDDRRQMPDHPFNQARYRGGDDPGGRPKLRLRFLARARTGGAPTLGHPRHRGHVVRRDLLR